MGMFFYLKDEDMYGQILTHPLLVIHTILFNCFMPLNEPLLG